MLRQESSNYSPTRFSVTASSGEHDGEAAAGPSYPHNNHTNNNPNTFPGDTSGGHGGSTRQRISQQQLLRHSVGGRASYVSGMRSSTAYAPSMDGTNASTVNGVTPAPMTTGAEANNAHSNALALTPHTGPSPSAPSSPSAGGHYLGTEGDLVPGASSHPNTFSSAQPHVLQPVYTPPQDAGLTPIGEDFVHEVLAMNTMAMEQCYAALGSAANTSMAAATEEPMKILREAFMRLDDTTAQDLPGPLLDQLKATTLNNMGVVECNRGQPRQALSHFEAARQLEENNDMASPSVALNTCAAYNALRMYDKATAAALEAIEMLRALEAQRQRSRRIAHAMARHPNGDPQAAEAEAAALNDTLLLEAAAAPQIAESQNAALWGAAWNNLAVAQINTAREGASKDTSEYTNTLTLFQNAMRATQELLGPQHPMSRTVVETYRAVRLALRNHGAFKQHRTLLRAPLPPVDPREQAWEEEQIEPAAGQTRHNAQVKQRQQLTITFRGEVTGGQKLIERVDGTPYPGAAAEAYQSRRSARAGGGGPRSGRTSSSNRSTSNGRGRGGGGGGGRSASNGKRNGGKKQQQHSSGGSVSGALRGMPHSETLTRASLVYGNPHPLLYSPPPPPPQNESYGASAPPSLAGSARTPQPPPRDSYETAGAASQDGPHRHTSSSGRQDNSARRARPSPPPPSQQHQQQQQQVGGQRPPRDQNSASLRSGPQNSTYYAAQGFVLPPIAQSRRGDAATPSGADEDDMNRTNGTTCSSVFMHVPPPAPPRNGSPGTAGKGNNFINSNYNNTSNDNSAASAAATAARLQQSKMLLLASPTAAAGAADASKRDTAATAAVAAGRGGRPSSSAERANHDHLGSPSENDLLSASVDQQNGHVRSDGDGNDAASHELFQGMWVTADAHYVHRGPRVFGRPVYYTISTTLDVDEEGVAASAAGATAAAPSHSAAENDRHDGSKKVARGESPQTPREAQPGSQASSESAAGRAAPLPTLTYSDSSSGSDRDATAEDDSQPGSHDGSQDGDYHNGEDED